MSPLQRDQLEGAREALQRARDHSERLSSELATAIVWLALATSDQPTDPTEGEQK